MQPFRKTFLMKILKFIVLLSTLSLSGCATGYLYDGGPPSDECFTGIYIDGLNDISIQVIHNRGLITASGWKGPAASIPWNYLYFNGSISRHGEARGEITIYFSEFRELRIPNVIISLPNDRACSFRNSLTFFLAYTWEGRAYGENYSLTRRPP